MSDPRAPTAPPIDHGNTESWAKAAADWEACAHLLALSLQYPDRYPSAEALGIYDDFEHTGELRYGANEDDGA